MNPMNEPRCTLGSQRAMKNPVRHEIGVTQPTHGDYHAVSEREAALAVGGNPQSPHGGRRLFDGL